jgi:hypothetical protein
VAGKHTCILYDTCEDVSCETSPVELSEEQIFDCLKKSFRRGYVTLRKRKRQKLLKQCLINKVLICSKVKG